MLTIQQTGTVFASYFFTVNFCKKVAFNAFKGFEFTEFVTVSFSSTPTPDNANCGTFWES